MHTLTKLIVAIGPFATFNVYAQSAAQANLAVSPPRIVETAGACKIQLAFKPAVGQDMHGYLVVSRPDGAKLEIRGGPTHKGSGSQSDLGPVGNPFSCTINTKWGAVVPYIGPHGVLGKDASGVNVYSPDGNVVKPVGTTSITTSQDRKSTCAIANCVMTVVSAAGKSCKPYTVGTGQLRNSNTIISFALATCGVKDPLPRGIQASGWGTQWEP